MGRSVQLWAVVGVLCAVVAGTPFKRTAGMYGCRSGHCSMMVSVLRDPRLVPNWNSNAWDKAITQLHAYQQLFSNEDLEEPAARRRKRSANPPRRARGPRL